MQQRRGHVRRTVLSTLTAALLVTPFAAVPANAMPRQAASDTGVEHTYLPGTNPYLLASLLHDC
jgi:hypothetical protein